MGKKPNYELLKDAYAIIGGIPESAFDLDKVVTKKTRNIGCGTIACAAGWLGMHPQFKALGLRLTENDAWGGNLQFGTAVMFFPALAELFGISRDDAERLFSHRKLSEVNGLTDKQVWLNRVRAYLASKGAL